MNAGGEHSLGVEEDLVELRRVLRVVDDADRHSGATGVDAEKGN